MFSLQLPDERAILVTVSLTLKTVDLLFRMGTKPVLAGHRTNENRDGVSTPGAHDQSIQFVHLTQLGHVQFHGALFI